MNLTKPRLDQFKVTGTTVGDVYFPQTKLLLPFEGVNGATTTSDLSNSNHTPTFAGNAQISTAQSKFGGSSLYLDGSDQVDLGSSSDWNWPTPSGASGDFTIELWHRRTATSNWGSFFSTENAAYGGIGTAGFIFGYDSTNNKLGWYNGTWYYASSSGNTTLAVDTWYHIAAVRYGSTTKLYLNGVEELSFTDSGSYGTAKLWLGGRGDLSLSYGIIEGYIDDIRITKGVARYTSNFTAPTTAHLTSAGDANKQILVNSTADGVAIGRGGINQSRIAKAWVSFNGIPSTLDILDSYNISSVTDHGTGDYEVIFATAMSDANYSQVISSTEGGTNSGYGTYSTLDRSTTGRTADDSTTTSFGISNGQYGYGVRRDCSRTTVVIFGN